MSEEVIRYEGRPGVVTPRVERERVPARPSIPDTRLQRIPGLHDVAMDAGVTVAVFARRVEDFVTTPLNIALRTFAMRRFNLLILPEEPHESAVVYGDVRQRIAYLQGVMARRKHDVLCIIYACSGNVEDAAYKGLTEKFPQATIIRI